MCVCVSQRNFKLWSNGRNTRAHKYIYIYILANCNQEQKFLSKIGKHSQLYLKEIDATCRHQNCILPKYYDHQEELPDHSALSARPLHC